MKTELTSKERILATLERKPVDHIPLCFGGICHGWVQFIDDLYPDPFKQAAYYLELGVDTAINIGVPWRGTNSRVTVSEWTEKHNDEEFMVKEYSTEKGKLRQTVRKNSEYPHSSIPLMDDYNVPPGRSVKYLVEKEEDLEKLECILTNPKDGVSEEFYEGAREKKKFCEKNGIMLTGYLTGIGDPLMWLSGVENTIFSAIEEPEFMDKYIEILSGRDMNHLEMLINAGVDMIVRRGWYESMDFWSPQLYRRYLMQPLKREIEAAHQAGVKYTYVMNSGYTELADCFRELGFDMLSNVEPEKDDLALTKKEIGHLVTLCGGVNNYHVIEAGTEEDVEKAVTSTMELLSPGGGFILAPSDSILDTSATAQRNFYKMIEVWRGIA